MAGDKFDEKKVLQSGIDFLKKGEFSSSESMKQTLRKMSPHERYLFRVGVAQVLKSKVDDIVVRGDATKN